MNIFRVGIMTWLIVSHMCCITEEVCLGKQCRKLSTLCPKNCLLGNIMQQHTTNDRDFYPCPQHVAVPVFKQRSFDEWRWFVSFSATRGNTIIQATFMWNK